ncbi:MAG: hypothetical protein EBX56_11710, partial [Betaproteobacteria bacterium]|nr:hypothetical protein [Betaproteobacteria bacterium]
GFRAQVKASKLAIALNAQVVGFFRHLNQACCATCSWWEGERKLIKKEERDKHDQVTKKAYYLRIERDRKFRCLNLRSETSSMMMQPVQQCDQYRYLFT